MIRTLACAVLAATAIACGTEIRAQTFREDFQGAALDPNVWSVSLGDGAVTLESGWAVVMGGGGQPPVAITRVDPFPSGDFVVRVGAQYRSVAFCGDGFGALDNFFPFFPQGCRPFLLWQDSAGWYVYSGGVPYTGLGASGELGNHVYEWRYFGGR